MSSKEKTGRVRELIEPVIARENMELIDVEMVIEAGRPILRMYIDTIPPGTKERGVTVDDCQRVSRLAGDILDVEDAVPGNYHLEVSSPGLFRPLTRPEHYDRSLGERVRVKTYEKIDGRKVFIGTLVRREGDRLTIEIDGSEHQVALGDVAKANLEPLL